MSKQTNFKVSSELRDKFDKKNPNRNKRLIELMEMDLRYNLDVLKYSDVLVLNPEKLFIQAIKSGVIDEYPTSCTVVYDAGSAWCTLVFSFDSKEDLKSYHLEEIQEINFKGIEFLDIFDTDGYEELKNKVLNNLYSELHYQIN
jgi:hypothetical protein